MFYFFFNATATTDIYTLSLHDALPISGRDTEAQKGFVNPPVVHGSTVLYPTAEDLHAHRSEFQYGRHGTPTTRALQEDRKSTRLNSSHVSISYAVFCLKKKKEKKNKKK